MDRQSSHKKSSVSSVLGVPSPWDESSVISSSPCPNKVMVTYLQSSDLEPDFESETPHTLAVINHGGGSLPSTLGKNLIIGVNLPQLLSPRVFEVWRCSAPVLCDQVPGIRLAFTDEFVFGCVESLDPDGRALEDVTRFAYEHIFEYCRRSGFSHLLRMWNYFPGINSDQNGLERYRRFCIGRHQAFSTAHKEFASILPAASAVGTQGGAFQVLFLAGKRPGRPLENPRQVSAYEYPPIYGPKSPSFARATVNRTPVGSHLFVAGTASIVGHATQHHGDPTKQTLETLSNIEAILARVRRKNSELWDEAVSQGILKVFVRDPADFQAVSQTIEKHELGQGSILYVQGEMCRKDLLVEIEGVWSLPMEAPG